MEVRCPQCTQRLRYSDVLKNPLLRCRACGTTFRPAELAASVPDSRSAAEVENASRLRELYQHAGEPREPEPTVSAPAPERSSGIGKGVGTFGVIALLIAFKVGPRLMREIFRERPAPPPPPAHFREEHRQAIEKLVRDADSNREAQPVRIRAIEK